MYSPIQILQIVAFLDLLAAGLILPQLPNHARILGCNPLLIGTMGALYSGFQLLSGPIIEVLSDIKGKKTILILTISLCGTAYIVLGITTPIVLFLGLRAFLGFCKHTQELIKGLAPEYEKDKKLLSVVHGKLNTLSGIGMCIGPIIGGYISEAFPGYSFTITSIAVGAIFAINSYLVRKLPSEEIKEKEKEKAKEREIATSTKIINSLSSSVIQSIERFTKVDWSIYWEMFLLRALMLLCIGVYFCNFAVFLKVKHHIPSIDLGYVISFLIAVGSFNSYFMGFISKYYEEDKDFSKRNYHVFLTLTVSLLGMVVAPSVSVYVVFLVPLAISIAMGRIVSFQRLASKTEDSHKVVVLGVDNDLSSLLSVVSPMIAGLVGQYVGLLYVIYVSASLAAIGAYQGYKMKSKNNLHKRKGKSE